MHWDINPKLFESEYLNSRVQDQQYVYPCSLSIFIMGVAIKIWTRLLGHAVYIKNFTGKEWRITYNLTVEGNSPVGGVDSCDRLIGAEDSSSLIGGSSSLLLGWPGRSCLRIGGAGWFCLLFCPPAGGRWSSSQSQNPQANPVRMTLEQNSWNKT